MLEHILAMHGNRIEPSPPFATMAACRQRGAFRGARCWPVLKLLLKLLLKQPLKQPLKQSLNRVIPAIDLKVLEDLEDIKLLYLMISFNKL